MKLKYPLIKTIIGQLFIDILIVLALYYLIPSLMNYSTYSVELNFVQEYIGLSYFSQALFMFLPYTIIMLVILLFYLKDMIKYGNNGIDELPKDVCNKLNVRLLNAPLICYLIKIICIPMTVSITLISVSVPTIVIVKLTTILTFAFILDGAVIYTYTKYVLKKIVKDIGNFNNLFGKRFSIKNELLVQFISTVFASLIFILLLSYARIVEEKGDSLYPLVDSKISNFFDITDIDIEDEENILKSLKHYFDDDESYTFFCIKPDKQIIILDDKTLPDYTQNLYIDKMIKLDENRIYDVSKENQGLIKLIEAEEGQYYIYGIFFSVIPYVSIKYLLYAMGTIILLNVFIIIFYCNNMSKNISEVSSSIEAVVSHNEIDFDKKLSVTSNDEIGELVVAFNKILELEKNNIETFKKNQEIMVEQERLSSLGQLIGGIAHNLKTPIMSIAGVGEALTDLINEYDESIDDPNVTKDDHHEIANDMRNWIEKVKPYLSYMTDIIDAVKGQAVSMNASTMKSFTAKELVLRIQILMKNELKRRHCTLNLDNLVNESTPIAGEISAIIQVIDNMIINSMDAYKDAPGSIDIVIKEDESKVYIDVKDYAGGIPKKVQEKLFTEMVTSKGKNGTGLGLYMSFSTIKGKFKGDIKYETKEGKGTTFFIELPKYIPGMENQEEEEEI